MNSKVRKPFTCPLCNVTLKGAGNHQGSKACIANQQKKLTPVNPSPVRSPSNQNDGNDSPIVSIKLYDLNELIGQIKILNAKIDCMDLRLSSLTSSNAITSDKMINKKNSNLSSNQHNDLLANQSSNQKSTTMKSKFMANASTNSSKNTIVVSSSPESASLTNKPKPKSKKYKVGNGKIVSEFDLETLKANKWLNDEIINAYFSLLQKNDSIIIDSLQINNFLNGNHIKIRTWYQNNLFKSTDFNSIKFIIFPICIKHHWTLVVINIVDKTFTYYNSLSLDKMYEPDDKFINCIISGIHALFPSINIFSFHRYFPKDIPQQNNGVDCGVFICLYLRYLFYYDEFTFNQSMIQSFRLLIKSELVDDKLKCIKYIDNKSSKLKL